MTRGVGEKHTEGDSYIARPRVKDWYGKMETDRERERVIERLEVKVRLWGPGKE